MNYRNHVLKIVQIDIEQFSKFYLKHIDDEREQRLSKYILESANDYLELMQKHSPLQQKRAEHASSIARHKRYETQQRIADYARRDDLFDNDTDKYKIANIAKHIDRTDTTVRNVFVAFAKWEEITITGKLQQYVPKLCNLLMKRHKANL